MLALQLLGWAGSALLVYSVLQTRILRLRVLNGVASAVLAVFNAAIAVWPMVAMNLVLTAINAFYVVRLVRRRHDVETFEVIKISPKSEYLKYLLQQFHAGSHGAATRSPKHFGLDRPEEADDAITPASQEDVLAA